MDAMKFDPELIRDGKKLRRQKWASGRYIMNCPDGIIRILGGTTTVWEILQTDIFSDDWEVVPEEHDFQWAVRQLLEGQTVRRRIWSELSHHLIIVDGRVVRNNEVAWTLTTNCLTATDWELYGQS